MRLVALLAVVGCAVPPPQHALPPLVSSQDMTNDEFDARLVGMRATLARSGIELDDVAHVDSCTTAHFRDCVHCEVARRDNTKGIDAELIDSAAIAFAMYPPKLLAATNVKHVALCLSIRVDEHQIAPAGMAFLDQHRILVSVGAFDHAAEGFTIGRVVHHELFHLLDHAGDRFEADREWVALNPKGFAYRDPGMLYRDREMDDTRPAGFVRDYATQNEAEDRASTFELMVGRPEELCAIAAEDPIVAKKVALLENRVRKVAGKTSLLAACPKRPRPAPHEKQPIDLRARDRD